MRQLFRATGAAAAVIAAAAILGAFTSVPASGSARTTRPAQRAAAGQPARIQAAHLALPAGVIRVRSSAGIIDATSHRWSGYAASGKGARFRYVRAAFFVPYIDCASTPDAFSGDWLGMDGFQNHTVEGMGIFVNCKKAAPEYRPWLVMYPKHAIYPDITVRPGQSIVASIFYSSSTRKFRFRMINTTTGHHFSRSLSCPAGSACPRLSAEVNTLAAVNSPTDRTPLTNYRAVSFSDVALADQAGHRSGFRSARWKTYKITTVNFGGGIMDRPTALLHGDAFSNYWIRPH